MRLLAIALAALPLVILASCASSSSNEPYGMQGENATMPSRSDKDMRSTNQQGVQPGEPRETAPPSTQPSGY